MIGFARPEALLLWPLAIGWWWRCNRGPAAEMASRGRRRAASALRVVGFTLLVAYLAGLRQQLPGDGITVAVLVDRSLSARHSAAWVQRWLAGALAARPPGVKLALVEFAGTARLTETASLHPFVPEAAPGGALNREESCPEAALSLAAASLPPGDAGRLVLLSDGLETSGSLARAALSLSSLGLQLDTVPLPPSTEPEALVEELRCPPRVRRRAPFDLVCTVAARQPASDAVLQLLRDGHLVGSFQAPLQAGRNVFLLPQAGAGPGAHRFEARLSLARDGERGNNSASGVTLVEGPARVLSVHAPGVDRLGSILQQAGLDVDSVTPAELPEEPGEWLSYGCVVVNDVAATAWSSEALELLPALVREAGLGLVVWGGPDSFAAGGYGETPLAGVLPVELRVPRRKLSPASAQLHVIDKSGSMAEVSQGAEKMALAREASIAALGVLTQDDLFGVIGFDGAAKWVVPLQPARRSLASSIASLRADGGTDLYPALKLAVDKLSTTPLSLRHVVVLSDGATAPAAFDALSSAARRNHVVITAVAVGEDADRVFLQRLASLGKGRFYAADSPRALPRIFARETLLAARSAFDERPCEVRRVSDHPVSAGLGKAHLLGHNLVSARGGSALLVLASEKGDPLLAVGRAGAGKTVAFTGDDGRRWSTRWGATPFAALVLQATRWSLPDPRGALDLDVEALAGGALRLRVKGNVRGGVSGTLLDQRGRTHPVDLVPVASDRFEATLDGGSFTTGVLRLSSGDGRAIQPIAGASRPELSSLEPADALLREAAETSGGRFRPDPRDIFRSLPHAPGFPREWGSSLLRLSLLLLLLEVALRRLPAWTRPAGAAAEPPDTSATLNQLRRSVEQQRLPRPLPLTPVTPAAPAMPVTPAAPVTPVTPAAPTRAESVPGSEPPGPERAAAEDTLAALRRARGKRP